MDILDKSVVSKLLNEVEMESNLKRKRREYHAYRILEGDLDFYVKNRNAQIFPETHKYLRVSQVDISGRVVNKLAQAYIESPKRNLSNEASSEIYNSILRESNSEEALMELDRNYHNNFEAGLWITFDQDADNPFYFRTLKSFEYDRVVNQRGETEVVILSFPSEEVTGSIYGDHVQTKIQDEHEDQSDRIYGIWTADHFVKVVRSGKDKDSFVNLEDNPNNENPLGFLPFAFIQRSRTTMQQPTNTLAERSVEWNSQNSVVNSYLDLIYGTWVLSHDDSQEIDVLKQGLYSFVKLPQRADGATTTLTHESPAPNIAAAREVLMDQINAILEDHGINSGGGVRGNSFSSALERMIANADVTQHIRKMQKRYFQVEKLIYRVVSEYLLIANMGNITNEDLNIVYPEFKSIQTDQEKIDNISKLIDLGLISRVEGLSRIYPNITREKAEELVSDATNERSSQLLPESERGNQSGS